MVKNELRKSVFSQNSIIKFTILYLFNLTSFFGPENLKRKLTVRIDLVGAIVYEDADQVI